MLLFLTLLAIGAAAAVPRLALQIQRDREEELIHRGMEYRRAIRAFAKHTARFPLTLAELENINGMRYLRRQYKDPITGGEFRLLHPGDIRVATRALDASHSQPVESADTGAAVSSGGVIVGVASASSKKTVLEFNHRDHYNQWLFFYDPEHDRAFPAKGPTPLTALAAVPQNPQDSSSQPTEPSSPQQ
jgi:type II secretory pathway pseudopilin PulG